MEHHTKPNTYTLCMGNKKLTLQPMKDEPMEATKGERVSYFLKPNYVEKVIKELGVLHVLVVELYKMKGYKKFHIHHK